MSTKVEIGIFRIGGTVVDRSEVQKWLDFIEVPDTFTLPPDGAVSDPALLIALAAKRCYMSFDVSMNSNLSRVRTDWAEYIDNILKSGHGSVLEHAVHNFAIENVSRVFTGEMNRHRAGWAISEGSMRFIRFSDNIKYWEPDSIRGLDTCSPQVDFKLRDMDVEDMEEYVLEVLHGSTSVQLKKHLTRIVVERAFDEMAAMYRAMEAIWKEELAPESKFQEKKQIPMMRRIIGMGVATGGVWSGNIRAVRHVLTMRCEPAAEEEILHVFSRIAGMMLQREPMLLGDFTMDEAGFWRPKYRKV
jgi:thymidylate synthase (FAD)